MSGYKLAEQTFLVPWSGQLLRPLGKEPARPPQNTPPPERILVTVSGVTGDPVPFHRWPDGAYRRSKYA